MYLWRSLNPTDIVRAARAMRPVRDVQAAAQSPTDSHLSPGHRPAELHQAAGSDFTAPIAGRTNAGR